MSYFCAFFDSEQIPEGSNSVLCRTCRFKMISTECEVWFCMICFDIHHFLWYCCFAPKFLNEQGATRSAASMGEDPLAVLECQQPVLFSCSEGKGMSEWLLSSFRFDMALCFQVETTQGFQEYKKHAKTSRIRMTLMYFNTVASWSSTPRNRISFAPPTPFLWVPLQICSVSDSRIFPGHVLDLCWILQRNEFTMQMSRQSSLAPNWNFFTLFFAEVQQTVLVALWF